MPATDPKKPESTAKSDTVQAPPAKQCGKQIPKKPTPRGFWKRMFVPSSGRLLLSRSAAEQLAELQRIEQQLIGEQQQSPPPPPADKK